MIDRDFNTNSSAHHAANFILTALPDDIRVPYEEHNAINPNHVEPLADLLQLVIAIVVASILDAGSERDVVIEDDNLHTAIINQLKEWTPPNA
jgi:hypothetical protein